jgi:BRCA1-associated protein
MPEFFFHISIELISDNPTTSKQSDEVIVVAWPTGVQALSPFVPGNTSKTKDIKRSLDARRPGVASASRSEGKAIEGGRNGLDLTSNGHQTNDLPRWPTTTDDKRRDHIHIESMSTFTRDRTGAKVGDVATDNHISKGIGTAATGLQTKGRYEPLDQQVTESVWGVVHLYRDADETPGLYGDSLLSRPNNPWYSGAVKEKKRPVLPPAADQDCTTLCILAVPSYLAPSDFLGFVGEGTRNQVSHFRMIRTARANRYMVLMKFRDGKVARNWEKEWNGKVFNSMEVCTTSDAEAE